MFLSVLALREELIRMRILVVIIVIGVGLNAALDEVLLVHEFVLQNVRFVLVVLDHVGVAHQVVFEFGSC